MSRNPFGVALNTVKKNSIVKIQAQHLPGTVIAMRAGEALKVGEAVYAATSKTVKKCKPMVDPELSAVTASYYPRAPRDEHVMRMLDGSWNPPRFFNTGGPNDFCYTHKEKELKMKPKTKSQLEAEIVELKNTIKQLADKFDENVKHRREMIDKIESLESKRDRLVIALKEMNAANMSLLDLL